MAARTQWRNRRVWVLSFSLSPSAVFRYAMTGNDRREIYAISTSTCASFLIVTRVVRYPDLKHGGEDDDNGREHNV